jgi:hypothetical protein
MNINNIVEWGYFIVLSDNSENLIMNKKNDKQIVSNLTTIKSDKELENMSESCNKITKKVSILNDLSSIIDIYPNYNKVIERGYISAKDDEKIKKKMSRKLSKKEYFLIIIVVFLLYCIVFFIKNNNIII